MATTRTVLLFGLAAFLQGSGVGSVTPQLARFAIYSHNAGTDRPQTKLGETLAYSVGRDDPVRGINPLLLLAPLLLLPDTYWLALQTDQIAGAGKLQARGLTGGGRSIIGAPAPYAAGAPANFPAGGVASTNRLGFGAVYAAQPRSLTGAIVGTFIVGDGTLVGQGPIVPLQDPVLLLRGKAFVTGVFTDLKVAEANKSSLILRGKLVSVTGLSSVVMGDPTLYLLAKSVTARLPTVSVHAKAALILRGKPFTALQTTSTVNVGKPKLILRGKRVTGAIPGLSASPPVDANLTPTIPGSTDLTPSAPDSIDLVPTREEFR